MAKGNRKVRGASSKNQNANYKASGQRDTNKLERLARANRKNPNDSQTAEAYVNQYHKVNG